MTKKAVFLIIPDGFRDEEYQIPKEIFEQNNIQVQTASSLDGELVGKLGKITATVDLLIQDIDLRQFTAIILVGGGRTFWNDSTVIALLQQADRLNKIIGAICSSAVLPAQAGLLKQLPATAYPGEPELLELQKYQALYQDQAVVTAGKIVTANGPAAAKQFGEQLVKLINQY